MKFSLYFLIIGQFNLKVSLKNSIINGWIINYWRSIQAYPYDLRVQGEREMSGFDHVIMDLKKKKIIIIVGSWLCIKLAIV